MCQQMPLSLRHPGSSKADKDENGKPIFKRRDSTIVPTKTQWSVVTIVGIGSLLTNTASSSLMVCQALWLAEVFNFRSALGTILVANGHGVYFPRSCGVVLSPLPLRAEDGREP